MLASDREREATVLRLRAAHLEGRLETDELERRVGVAEAARTREDLATVEADLPRRPVAVIPPAFHGPEEVREAALAFIVPPLERYGRPHPRPRPRHARPEGLNMSPPT
jgi:Domain of unknown function (DUF1707)